MNWALSSSLGVAFFLSPLSTLASCKEDGLEAKRFCSSQEAIEKVGQAKEKIESSFRPKNGRMSPESCQGFREGYHEFRGLVDEYIKQCDQKIAKARLSCVNSIPDIGEFQDDLAGILATREGVNSLPVLRHYKPALDSLNSRLSDCLKDTPGGIVNTNSDRGTADTRGRVETKSAEVQAPGYGGVGAVYSRSYETEASGVSSIGKMPARIKSIVNPAIGSLCSDPAFVDSFMCSDPKLKVESQRVAIHRTGNDKLDQGTRRLERNSIGLREIPKSFAIRRAVSAQTGIHSDFEADAYSSERKLGRPGIANRHSNLFTNIRNRYSKLRPTLFDR